MNEKRCLPSHLLDRISEHLRHARIDEGGACVGVDCPDSLLEHLDELAVSLLARSQRILGAPSLGDIEGGERHAAREVFRDEGRRAEKNIDHGAVLAPPTRFDRSGAFQGYLPVLFMADEIEFLIGRVEHPRRLPDELIPRVPRHRADLLVDLEDDALRHETDADGAARKRLSSLASLSRRASEARLRSVMSRDTFAK